jgi:hypothetical protein
MAGRLDKPRPFCLFLDDHPHEKRVPKEPLMPDPKSARCSKKLDHQAIPTGTHALAKSHASVSLRITSR